MKRNYYFNLTAFFTFFLLISECSYSMERLLISDGTSVLSQRLKSSFTSQFMQKRAYRYSIPKLQASHDMHSMDILKGRIRVGYKGARTTTDKDIVLVTGTTSSGKTTLIERLLGTRMVKEKKGARFSARPITPPITPLGGDGAGFAAQTLFPEVYSKNPAGLNYCDFPGFFSTVERDRIPDAVLSQIAVKKSRSAKAIMVVIDAGSFKVQAAEPFRDLGTAMGKVLQNKLSAAPVLFVVNKDEQLSADDVLTSVKEMITIEERKLRGEHRVWDGIKANSIRKWEELRERFGRGSLRDCYYIYKTADDVLLEIFFGDRNTREQHKIHENIGMLNVLKLMNKENVIVANVFDETDTNCNEIENALLRVSRRPATEGEIFSKDDLRFDSDGSVRDSFCKAALRMISDDLPLFNERENLSRTIINFQSSQSERADFFKSLTKDIKKLKKSKEDLSTDKTPTLYWSRYAKEKRHPLFGFMGRTTAYFKYEEGIPFVSVKETVHKGLESGEEEGKFIDDLRVIDENNAIYSSVFKSYLGKDGNATVGIYVQKKDHPSTKESLEDIDKQITKKTEEKADLAEQVIEDKKEAKDKLEDSKIKLENVTSSCLENLRENGSSEVTYDILRSGVVGFFETGPDIDRSNEFLRKHDATLKDIVKDIAKTGRTADEIVRITGLPRQKVEDVLAI